MATMQRWVLWGTPPHTMPVDGLRIKVTAGNLGHCRTERTYRRGAGWTAGTPGNR